MIRIKEIFDLLDDEKKGCILFFKAELNFDNLKKHYSFGFTIKEIEEIFTRYDKNKDGKLELEDFAKVILPPDYAIEEKDEIL